MKSIRTIGFLFLTAIVVSCTPAPPAYVPPPPDEVAGIFAVFAGAATNAYPSTQKIFFSEEVISNPVFKEGISNEADFLAQLTSAKGLPQPLTYYDYVKDEYRVGPKSDPEETPWYTIDPSTNQYRYKFSRSVAVPTRSAQFEFACWKITSIKPALTTQYGPNPDYNLEDDDPNNDEAEIQIGDTLYAKDDIFDLTDWDWKTGAGIVLEKALVESKSAQITLTAQWDRL
ncbi:hypothetical protein FACS1894102_3180 [Spirochaetia bacterium]|nr:hypothetical protein FACS1894102_3180 [Spirochaetia bacterium]